MGIEAPPLRVKVYKGPNKVSLRLSIKSEIIIMISDFIPKNQYQLDIICQSTKF